MLNMSKNIYLKQWMKCSVFHAICGMTLLSTGSTELAITS